MCKRILVVAVALCLAALAVPTGAAGKKAGKFFIVGMGPHPDLVTVRGMNVIKKADLFLLESQKDLEVWKQFVGKKPVIYSPHMARIFFGTDASKLTDPDQKALAEKNDAIRKDVVDKIRKAVEAGKTVVSLQWGDPMMFGNLFYLEMLPPDFPSEIVPGVGAFQAGTAALKRCAAYGWDTNGVILTMGDWPGRADTNEKLMAVGSSMVFYTMGFQYPDLFAQLAKTYPADTPVAVVSYAGDPAQQTVTTSNVGKFLTEVDWAKLPPEMHTLFVGKFITAGQARKDGVIHGKNAIEMLHGDDLDDKPKGTK